MIRERRFMAFAFAALLLAVAWLLLGTYARQIEARTVCPDWPECYRPALALPVDDAPPNVSTIAATVASSRTVRAAAVTVISAAVPDPVKYGA
mgnify:CR=1 FL=1